MNKSFYESAIKNALSLRQTAHKWFNMCDFYARSPEDKIKMQTEGKRCMKSAILFLRWAKKEKTRGKTS